MLIRSFHLLAAIIFLSSCSNLVKSTRESLLGDKKKRESSKQDVKWVSKAQFDDLMTKYKTLNMKYENLKENNMSSPGIADETIDVFANANSKLPTTSESKPQSNLEIEVSRIDEEIDYYKKARLLKRADKLAEALKLFQFLEKAQSPQIQVRAKMNIGDIYLAQKQYDLALQVYESIIRQHSFSGTVIPALRSAMICSGELGLVDKKEQYQSILKDFFGMQV